MYFPAASAAGQQPGREQGLQGEDRCVHTQPAHLIPPSPPIHSNTPLIHCTAAGAGCAWRLIWPPLHSKPATHPLHSCLPAHPPEPTNEMAAMSGWSRMRLTVSWVPCTMFSTPLGRPAGRMQRQQQVAEVLGTAGSRGSSCAQCQLSCSTTVVCKVDGRKGMAKLRVSQGWHVSAENSWPAVRRRDSVCSAAVYFKLLCWAQRSGNRRQLKGDGRLTCLRAAFQLLSEDGSLKTGPKMPSLSGHPLCKPQ